MCEKSKKKMSETEAKKQRLDVVPNQIAVAGPSTEHPSAKIFKLNIDCFEKLSLKDLRALHNTCKRMQKIIQMIFQLNYPRGFGIYHVYIDNKLSYCKLDKYIQFNLSYKCNIENIQHILYNVEIIEIHNNNLNSFKKECSIFDFYNDFLRYCVNLKCLYINKFNDSSFHYPLYDKYLIRNENNWLYHQYKKLEHLILIDFKYDSGYTMISSLYVALRTFFKKKSKYSYIFDNNLFAS